VPELNQASVFRHHTGRAGLAYLYRRPKTVPPNNVGTLSSDMFRTAIRRYQRPTRLRNL